MMLSKRMTANSLELKPASQARKRTVKDRRDCQPAGCDTRLLASSADRSAILQQRTEETDRQTEGGGVVGGRSVRNISVIFHTIASG